MRRSALFLVEGQGSIRVNVHVWQGPHLAVESTPRKKQILLQILCLIDGLIFSVALNTALNTAKRVDLFCFDPCGGWMFDGQEFMRLPGVAA